MRCVIGHIAVLSASVLLTAAAPAEEAAPVKAVEIKCTLQATGAIPCATPKEARGVITVMKAGETASAMPITGLSAQVQRGVLTVLGPGPEDRSVGVGIPPNGYSRALGVTVPAGEDRKVQYALTFAWTGRSGEYYVRNCTVCSGWFDSVPFVIVDDNCNGKYNDVGEDAMLLGNAALAAPLGSAVMLGGKSYSLQVSEFGDKVTITPQDGFKPGLAMVSERDGGRLLLGAVLKGPDGGYHLVGDQAPAVLPAGSHTLEFAAIGNARAGNLAFIESSGVTLNVPEGGNKIALLTLGKPTVKLDVTYDPAKDRVLVAAPNLEEVTCKAGKVRFVHVIGVPELAIVDPSDRRGRRNNENEDRVKERLRFIVGRDGKPEAMGLDRDRHDLSRGKKYRFDLTWPNGVMDKIEGSTTLEIPYANQPAKKGTGK